jgi:hypothetical protein
MTMTAQANNTNTAPHIVLVDTRAPEGTPRYVGGILNHITNEYALTTEPLLTFRNRGEVHAWLEAFGLCAENYKEEGFTNVTHLAMRLVNRRAA